MPVKDNNEKTNETAETPAENEDQTWISDKDADGETKRVKTEEYAEWRADQDKKLANKR